MQAELSGVSTLKLGFGNSSCRWGTHIAGLYEFESERDRIVTGFMRKGLEEGDFLLYCPAEQGEAQFRKTMEEACPEYRDYLDDPDRIRITTPREVYYPDGHFSPWDMDRSLIGLYEEQQIQGPRNIRAAAEMTWALEKIPGSEHLMAYEARLNFMIPSINWVSICMYNINKFTKDAVVKVLRTHPYIINRGVLAKNPYFEPPVQWLQDNAPQYLGAAGA